MTTAITTELLRSCIRLEKGSREKMDERKRTMPLKNVTHLVFSFKGLRSIDYLVGLQSLTKLQLDNNNICKIENISHLTNLTLLDISFNKIQKIEGLEALTKLDDLSLYSNQIEHIEGLDSLQHLTSISLGKNCLANIEEVMYLRRLKKLKVLTLLGNPFCKNKEYKSYVIGHLRDLSYLDHRFVDEATLNAAKDLYQDELLEISLKESDEEILLKAAQEKAARKELYKEANLSAIDTMFEDMLAEDPKFEKMKELPGLLDPLDEYKEKYEAAKEELAVIIIEQHQSKKEELHSWQSAINELLDKRDENALLLVSSFNKLKKQVFAEISKDHSLVEEKMKELKDANDKLKERLLELEMISFGEVQVSIYGFLSLTLCLTYLSYLKLGKACKDR